jgi:hypothetical protein
MIGQTGIRLSYLVNVATVATTTISIVRPTGLYTKPKLIIIYLSHNSES